jgi:hypothetical protein
MTDQEKLAKIRELAQDRENFPLWVKILSIIDGDPKSKKTPADRLAEVATVAIGVDRPATWASDLADAIGDYRSTRNGVGQTVDEAIGSPPDPVKVARLMLDALTGGALSSLICMVRDTADARRRPRIFAPDAEDNIRANLRALGEKIGD